MGKMQKMLCAAALGASMVSVSQAREFADIYTECGLGAMIAPNNEAVAAVTNVTWDLGTTAISSNVLSPETCKGGSAQTAAMIYQAYPSIQTDLAKGQGEHLSALLTLAGCDEQKHVSVSASMRQSLAQQLELANVTHYEQAESLFQLVEEHTQSCVDA